MTTYKNNRGKWCVDIDDFYHPDGRKEPRIRKTSPVQSKPGAERYERDIRDALQKGTYSKVPDGDVPTLASFVESFIANEQSERKSETGIYNNESLFRAHLIELFGNRRMTSFSKKDELALKTHFKNHSVSRYHQAAAAMNGAIELYYVAAELKEPFKFGRLKKPGLSTKPFYEFGQYARLLKAARSIGVNSELVVLLGRDAGLRRSEMWGLTPAKVRMKERKLIIEQAETVIGKRRVMKSTKGNALRTIRMTPALHDCFRRYFLAYGSRERIVAQNGDDGEPHTQKTFERLMSVIQEAAGLEPTGEVHILRHTCCSHMAILGVPVMVIQKVAGHQQLSTTLDYMHLAPGDDQIGTDALSRAIPQSD